MKRKIVFIVMVLMMTKGLLLPGQILSLPTEGSKNSLGVGINGGIFLDKEDVFVGPAADYSRLLWGNWILNVSLCFDQEHEAAKNNETNITNTLSPALAIELGYGINF